MTSPAKGNMGDPAAESQVPITAYEPTPRDKQLMQAYFDHQRANPPPPRLKVIKEEGGVIGLVPEHPDSSVGLLSLVEALGLKDPNLGRELLSQMALVANGNEDTLNAMIAFVRGLDPRDSLEATLATQMAATHVLTMTFARRLNHVETIDQQDTAERAFNKLGRTFALQVETLKRYRTGGEQRVTVQHVTVNDNAQAIVGDVSSRGGGSKKNSGPTS